MKRLLSVSAIVVLFLIIPGILKTKIAYAQDDPLPWVFNDPGNSNPGGDTHPAPFDLKPGNCLHMVVSINSEGGLPPLSRFYLDENIPAGNIRYAVNVAPLADWKVGTYLINREVSTLARMGAGADGIDHGDIHPDEPLTIYGQVTNVGANLFSQNGGIDVTVKELSILPSCFSGVKQLENADQAVSGPEVSSGWCIDNTAQPKVLVDGNYVDFQTINTLDRQTLVMLLKNGRPQIMAAHQVGYFDELDRFKLSEIDLPDNWLVPDNWFLIYTCP